MKITLERLREIITEEVIKEELALDIAAPAIAAMLQGTDSVDTSEIFGAVFDQMYGEGALEGEAERMAGAEEEPEEDFPTDYQPGGGEGDRPVMGFKENINEIIQEEYYTLLLETEWKYSQWGKDPETGAERSREEWARDVLSNPEKYERDDVYEAEKLEADDFPPHPDEFLGAAEPAQVGRGLRNTPDEIAKVANTWGEFINNTSRENIPQAIATLKAEGPYSGEYRGKTIVPILKALYDKLRNFEHHPQ